MKNDQRLAPWLSLASEFDAFDLFMREHQLALIRADSAGLPEAIDTGALVVRRIRTIAMNRWTWYGWKRKAIVGEVRAKLHTFNRCIAEGFFFGGEETKTGRDMMARLKVIKQHFERLVAASREMQNTSQRPQWVVIEQ